MRLRMHAQIPIARGVPCSLCSGRKIKGPAPGERNGRTSASEWCHPRLEEGKPAFTSFANAEVETAVAMSAAKYDGIVFEMEHNPWDSRALRDCLQYMLNRRAMVQGGTLAPSGDADRAHSAQRRRVEPVARQAGARPRRLRHRVAAHLDGRAGLQRRRRLPLSAAADRAALRAGGHPRRRPDRGRALLGPHPAEYYASADVWPLDPNGEILVHAHDRGHPGHRQPRRILNQVPGIGVDPDRRGRPLPGTRPSPPIRAPEVLERWRTSSRPARRTRSRRPSPRRREQRRAHPRRGLHAS